MMGGLHPPSHRARGARATAIDKAEAEAAAKPQSPSRVFDVAQLERACPIDICDQAPSDFSDSAGMEDDHSDAHGSEERSDETSDGSDDGVDDAIWTRRALKQRSAEVISRMAPSGCSGKTPLDLQHRLLPVLSRADAPSGVVRPGSSERQRLSVDATGAASVAPSIATGSLWDGLPADVLVELACRVDALTDAVALAATCHGTRAALLADAIPWRAHAWRLGICCSDGAPSTAGDGAVAARRRHANALLAAIADVWTLRAGDCIEVRDPFDLWAAARIVAVVTARLLSPAPAPEPAPAPARRLLLVHFEGYSRRWLMWLDRDADQARLRPLSGAHIGTLGAHTYTSWTSMRTAVLSDLARDGGRSVWPAVEHRATTRDDARAASGLPAPYRHDAAAHAVRLALEPAQLNALWRAPTRAFCDVHAYGKDLQRCRAVHRAALAAPPPCAD